MTTAIAPSPVSIQRERANRLKARIDSLYADLNHFDPNAPDWSRQCAALWVEIRTTENQLDTIEDALAVGR